MQIAFSYTFGIISCITKMSDDTEKASATVRDGSSSVDRALENDVEHVDLAMGYTVEVADAASLKLAKDGHTVLIPQPSDDPLDPLNFSTYKKHLFLFIISATAFLPDFGSAVGAVTLLPQAG